MLAHVNTAAVRGVDAYAVRAEVNLSTGLPAFTVVGLAQGSVREGRERVAAALRNTGYGLPNRRITVNLAPADVRKEGTAFDLPIAVGILAAAGHVPPTALEATVLLGELGLDGRLRPVSGVLPVALWAKEAGMTALVVPEQNAEEASLVAGLTVVPAREVDSVVRYLREGSLDRDVHRERGSRSGEETREAEGFGSGRPDLADVRGQDTAKRALEIAAAGRHNLLMVGPPGAGKTMLARRLPGILPPLSLRERIEVARIHSVAGLLVDGQAARDRPFRAPHHSVSYAGLVGGGSPLRPGEVSLAHNGVLFLDELPEYRRNVLEVLRQPLEEGAVTLARASGAIRFPARFILIAAMNPCPCGRLGDGSDRCLCDAAAVNRYRGRVSGPLLDRIDLRVDVAAVPVGDLQGRPRATSVASSAVAQRVGAASARQAERFQGERGLYANAHMSSADLGRWCRPSAAVADLLRRAAERASLTARGYDRVRRVARTIADLEGSDRVLREHAAEALQFRLLSRLED
jgi:magnesium chelatase family protein